MVPTQTVKMRPQICAVLLVGPPGGPPRGPPRGRRPAPRPAARTAAPARPRGI